MLKIFRFFIYEWEKIIYNSECWFHALAGNRCIKERGLQKLRGKETQMVKKMLKRWIPMLLVCTLLLAGCGNSEAKESSTQSHTESESQTEVSSAEGTTEEENTTQEPSADESTTEEESAEESSTEEETSGETEPETVSETDENGLLLDSAFTTVEETVYAVSNVNLRQSPTTEIENIYNVLRTGESAVRIGYREDWSIVKLDGQKLYVSSQYLSTTAPETLPPETAPPQNTGNSTVVTPPASGNGIIVCIDAGHQQAGISEKEPNGPGSDVMKAKLTTGTQGCATGKPEYQLNLEVSLLLKQELLNRGYQVVMIRENNDCPASNAERAQIANASGASIFIRIHANSSTDSAMNGCLTMAPTAANPYVSYLAGPSQALSQSVVNHICAQTGFRNIGVLGTDTMSGINWCTIPVTIVEMGYMSNPDEDMKMSDPGYQSLIARGIANGVDEYFASH